MIIAPFSDLHLDCADMFLPEREGDKDAVCVIAGDLGSIYDNPLLHSRILPFLQRACHQFRHVIYVLGNHEHDRGIVQGTIGELNKAIDALYIFNLSILEKQSVVVDGVAFIGATMWTSCDNLSPYASFYWGGMSDYDLIRYGPTEKLPYVRRLRAEDTWDEWNAAKSYIFGEIEKQRALGNKVCVVTHHAPSNRSIHPDYVGTSTLNMFFSSSMDLDIMDMPPDVWIHGHVHQAFDYPIDSTGQICNTRVICNPRGYVGFESSPKARGFDAAMRIEI